MNYVIQNISGSVLQLADLKVQLDPGQSVDLLKVTTLDSINRSLDLKYCAKHKLVKLIGGKLKVDSTKVAVPQNVVKEIRLEPTSNNNELNEKLDTILSAISNIKMVSGNSSGTAQAGAGENSLELNPESLANIVSKSFENVKIDSDSSASKKTVVKTKINIKSVADDIL